MTIPANTTQTETVKVCEPCGAEYYLHVAECMFCAGPLVVKTYYTGSVK